MCRICEQYQNLNNPEEVEGLIKHGKVEIFGKIYVWVVVPSFKWSVSPEKGGKHYIFNTFSDHVGPEEWEVRAELNKEATRVAYELFGPDYRMTNNSGLKASTLLHYHCHLVAPGDQRLMRAVTNTQEVLQQAKENFNLPDEVIDFLDKNLLQQKK